MNGASGGSRTWRPTRSLPRCCALAAACHARALAGDAEDADGAAPSTAPFSRVCGDAALFVCARPAVRRGAGGALLSLPQRERREPRALHPRVPRVPAATYGGAGVGQRGGVRRRWAEQAAADGAGRAAQADTA
eukprot:2968979-Pleurochrysis_carterae.AAC.1